MGLEELLHGAADAAFGISPDGQIVAWNDMARRLLGWTRSEVEGHTCAKVLACRDAAGSTPCEAVCPVLQALLRSQGTPATPVVVNHRSGRELRLLRSSIAVPSDAGHAKGHQGLVLLQPHSASIFDVAPLDKIFRSPADEPESVADNAITRIATSLETEIAEILDRLLLLSEAKSAEMFVALPGNPDHLVLGAHRGPARRAFTAQTEFQRGVGLPGLSIDEGPIVSLDLERDGRYIRKSVPQKGYSTCIAVPFPGSERPCGSILLTYDRSLQKARKAPSHEAHVKRAMLLLREVAEYVNLLLQVRQGVLAKRARHLELVDRQRRKPQPYDPGRRIAQVLAQATRADAVILKPASSGVTTSLSPAWAGRVSDRVANDVIERCSPESCPLARAGGGFFRPRDSTGVLSPPCAVSLSDWPRGLCLPLRDSDLFLGSALFLFRGVNYVPGSSVVPLDGLYRWATEILQRAGAEAQRPAVLSHASQEDRLGLPPEHGGEPPLSVYCLGRFEVFLNGQSLEAANFRRRHALALFKILLTNYGRGLHREQLADLLWPHDPTHRSESAVKVVVHHLRQVLASGRDNDRSEYIVTTDGGYAFNTKTPHFVDVQAFLHASNETRRAAERGEHNVAINSGRRAMELYRGDFLPEEPYAEWAAARREQVRHIALDTMGALASACIRQGELDFAVHTLRRMLEIDETLEDIHRQLMCLYWSMGRRHEAARQYDLCERALLRALDIEPEYETKALLKKIQTSSRQPR